jgi:glycine cleavage system H protein
MKIDDAARYLESHEYAKAYEHVYKIGISDQAQQSLGEIVFADLPALGATIKVGEVFCVLESAKAASDLYSPLSGTVVAVNQILGEDPGLINRDCYNSGWLVQIQPSRPEEWNELLSPEAYGALCADD